MKYLLLAVLSLGAVCSAMAQQTSAPFQTRCGPVGVGLLNCSFELYVNDVTEAGDAGQLFPKGDNPMVEYNAYVQNPSQYRPLFQVHERAANDYNAVPNYTPQNVKWSLAGSFIILEHTLSNGGTAHVAYEYLTQRYGCGRSSCVAPFWTVMRGTEYIQ